MLWQRRQGMLLVAMLLLAMPWVWASQELIEPTRQAITRAVDFLVKTQQLDGSFLVRVCFDQALTQCKPDSDAASTKPVLMGLSHVEDPRAASLLEKGAHFFLAQMDAQGFFRDPWHPDKHVYLATLCSDYSLLESLGFSMPPLIPKLLTYQTLDGLFYPYAIPLQEVATIKSGGPAQRAFVQRYYESSLQTIDQANPFANSVIFAYLVQHGQTPAGLCHYLVQAARQGLEPTEFGIEYESTRRMEYVYAAVISEGYVHGATCLEPAKEVIQPRLLKQQRPDGSWDDLFETTCAMQALMNFGYKGEALDRATQFLLGQQQPDGNWKRAVWYVQRVSFTVGKWLGSEEVSTGLVLEVLGQYLKMRTAAAP